MNAIATPAGVGRALSRAGFESTKGGAKAYGFKASKFLPGKVAVTANFNSEAREREARAAYASALIAAGYAVDTSYGTTLFVSVK